MLWDKSCEHCKHYKEDEYYDRGFCMEQRIKVTPDQGCSDFEKWEEEDD